MQSLLNFLPFKHSKLLQPKPLQLTVLLTGGSQSEVGKGRSPTLEMVLAKHLLLGKGSHPFKTSFCATLQSLGQGPETL